MPNCQSTFIQYHNFQTFYDKQQQKQKTEQNAKKGKILQIESLT